MEAVIITACVALANIACFLIGVKTGMAVAKDEPISLPMPRAFDYTKKQDNEYEQRAAEMVQQRFDTILQNIERYDGTSNGQRDVL